MKLQPRLVAKIMQAGMPSFSNQITNSILAIVLNNKLREYGGSVAIAGMGAVSSLQQLMILPIIGISQGSQPIIGYNRGARQYHRIRETLIKAIMAGTVIVVFGFLVTRLFPRNLISLFGNGEKFVAFGSKAISKWFLFLPVVGCQMVGSLYFQSVGKPKVSLFLTLTRQLIYLIPAIVLLSSQFGLNGILYAGPTADVLSFLTIATFLMFEFRRLNKLMDTSLT